MSQPHEHQPHGQSGAEPSRNVFVRFQKGFERRFNRFRDGYGGCSNGRSLVAAPSSPFHSPSRWLRWACFSSSVATISRRSGRGSFRCICGRRSGHASR